MLPRSTADLKISQISWFHFFKYLELFSSLFFAFDCVLLPAVRHLAGLPTDWRFRHFCRWLYSRGLLHHASNMLHMVQVCIRSSQQMKVAFTLFKTWTRFNLGLDGFDSCRESTDSMQRVPLSQSWGTISLILLHPPRIRTSSMEMRRAINYLNFLVENSVSLHVA